MISFSFCVYINISQKNVYECKLWWLPSSKNNTHVDIHKKQNKLLNVFIYKKSDTFQKARQFPLRFYIKKEIHLTLWDFHENFEVGIYIQKAWHFVLRDVFIYKKFDTSQKARQFAIRFYIQKFGTFALHDFSLNFWNLRRGWDIYVLKKQCTLCEIFILQKQCTLRYVAICKEPDTIRYILISKNQYTFL